MADAPEPRTARIRFEYALIGTGWARAQLSNGVDEVTMVPSYLGDALGDLTWAVVKLLEGSSRQTFEWWDEPGSWRWGLWRQGHLLDLHIWRLDARLQPNANQRIRTLFHTSCEMRQFANQLNNQLGHLNTDYGPDGYLQRWKRHSFPADAWQRLQAALNQTPP